jgi:flagellar hook protein FlgE
MGIHQSLYTAVTGLTANSDGMAVIANNIANANTKSFKTDRAEFEDLLSQSISENSQLGRGSKLRNITTNYSQGAMSPTGMLTDLAIQGDGFFVVRNENHEVKESNSMFFSRQGSFTFNKDGYLTDSAGGKVMGYMSEGSSLSSRLTPIQINTNTVAPVATSMMTVGANLDIREKPPRDEFDLNRPGDTSNFSSTVPIFDKMGSIHQVTTYFVRQPGEENRWTYYATVDGKEVDGAEAFNEKGEAIPTIIKQGEIAFDQDGKVVLPNRTKDGVPIFVDLVDKSDAVKVKFVNSPEQELQFNFGPGIDEKGGVGTTMCTSMAARSNTFSHSQNGFEAGALKTMKIDVDGSVRGVFTNGTERRLCAVALASIPNIQGLQKVGRNSYIATVKAGDPRIGLPQTGTRGSIYASALEESNVDIAQQFVDMITTQRAFQANSKSVTTTDTMLDDVINLKR